MTSNKLIHIVRSVLDDYGVTSPLKYSQEQILSALNQAEAEACRRVDLIRDDLTEAVCKIIFNVNDQRFLHNLSILKILECRCSISFPKELNQVSRIFLNTNYPKWRDTEAGTPKYFVCDANNKTIYLDVPAKESGELDLLVIRYPLADLVYPDGSPEIPPEYHYYLVWWAAFLLDGKKKWSRLFTEAIGEKRDALHIQQRKDVSLLEATPYFV